MDRMIVYPQNLYVEINPQCGDIWRWGPFGLNEIMMVEYPYKKRQERACFHSLCSLPYNKKTTVCKQGRGPSPWSWTFQPPELWEMSVVYTTQSMILCYSCPRRIRHSLPSLASKHLPNIMAFCITYFCVVGKKPLDTVHSRSISYL